jgi:hypothetical protein
MVQHPSLGWGLISYRHVSHVDGAAMATAGPRRIWPQRAYASDGVR